MSLFEPNLIPLLEPILAEAIRITGFEKGNIQLFNERTQSLSIVCQRGFEASFLRTFSRVYADTECACGRALKAQHVIYIDDVETDVKYGPYCGAAREAGYRSVLSLPIATNGGEILGIISVHHSSPQVKMPTNIDYLGTFAAELLVRQSFY